MSEREALQLIFIPGISLSPAITHVSGRGVGMDVVRTNVQKVGGSVEVESTLGSGTTLRLRVPLTLAIVPALLVRSAGHTFALPQHSLIELVHLPSCASDPALERIGTMEIFRLRDCLLPLVRLDRLLCIGSSASPAKAGLYIAVVEEGKRRFGVLIDALSPPEEIVVKPLSGVLRDIGMYSGATVLGNGELALILDVKAIADRAGHKPSADSFPMASQRPHAHSNDAESSVQISMLNYEIVKHNANRQTHVARMAMPLSSVERIERIPLSRVEYAEGKAVMHYRGELIALEDQGDGLAEMTYQSAVEDSKGLPLHPLSAPITSWAADPERLITVIICLPSEVAGVKRFGVVVRKVLNVSSGPLLAEDPEFETSPLAMLEDRAANLHVPPAVQLQGRLAVPLQEVA